MGFISKIKNILFDEEIVDVEVNNDELPERETENKKYNVNNSGYSRSGFIDHSAYNQEETEEDEEDVIKEVVLPKEDELEDKTIEIPRPEHREVIRPRTFNVYNDYEEKKEELPVRKEHNYGPRMDYASFLKNDKKEEKQEEIKDYRKIAQSALAEKNEKKPFKVTPVISPVYGIISETEGMRNEFVNIPEVIEAPVNPPKQRKFGPVSYNDTPIKEKTVVRKVTVEEHVYEPELPEFKKEVPVKEEVEEKKPIIQEEIEEYNDFEDQELSSPDYDSLPSDFTSGVEDEYLGNDIEDAFEKTEELNAIDESDKELESESTDDIIESVQNDNEDSEDMHLDDTIETDLFNLIDSMYKDSEDEEEDE